MSRYKCFFPGSNYHMFYVLYPFVTYLLSLPRRYPSLPSSESSLLWPQAITVTSAHRQTKERTESPVSLYVRVYGYFECRPNSAVYGLPSFTALAPQSNRLMH
jgi:hypothetical protein